MRVAVALIVLLTGSADAHIALRSPAPRTTELKAGPCGAAGSVRGATTTTYRPGQLVTVEWDETVDHPGHYRIAFDDDGDDIFVDPISHEDMYPWVMVEPIADQTGAMNHYTQQVTMPQISCTNCTLQLMQIMTTTEPFNSFYYQCADITLDPNADPGTTGEASGGCAAGGLGGTATGSALVLGALIVRARRRAARRSPTAARDRRRG